MIYLLTLLTLLSLGILIALFLKNMELKAVSYTHLTLPTIA